jgi:hypothetical protein
VFLSGLALSVKPRRRLQVVKDGRIIAFWNAQSPVTLRSSRGSSFLAHETIACASSVCAVSRLIVLPKTCRTNNTTPLTPWYSRSSCSVMCERREGARRAATSAPRAAGCKC